MLSLTAVPAPRRQTAAGARGVCSISLPGDRPALTIHTIPRMLSAATIDTAVAGKMFRRTTPFRRFGREGAFLPVLPESLVKRLIAEQRRGREITIILETNPCTRKKSRRCFLVQASAADRTPPGSLTRRAAAPLSQKGQSTKLSPRTIPSIAPKFATLLCDQGCYTSSSSGTSLEARRGEVAERLNAAVC